MAAPAALPPPGGGLPPQHNRSFLEALKSPAPSHPSGTTLSADHPNSTALPLPSDAHRLGSHKGSPAIYFKPSHIQTIVQPYHWTLIGKFTHGFNKQHPSLGRPPVEELVLYFKALDLKREVQLGLLDNRHVLIQIQHYDDFLRLYSRPVWYVHGKPMRIFKWTSSFHVDREAPFAPVWISFPRLPIHFFEKLTLMAIASLLGSPLRLDAPTLALKRPSIARVQVEIDLLKPRVEKIWIGVDEGEGFWQNIDYADVPDFCQHCNHVGHSDVHCHVRNPDLKVLALRKTTVPIRPGREQHHQQRFVPTGRQADPSGFFASSAAHPSTSDTAPMAPSTSPKAGVPEVLVAANDALLTTTQAPTDDAMMSNAVSVDNNAVSTSTAAEVVPPQLASNVVADALVGIPTQTRAEEPATAPLESTSLSVGIVDTPRPSPVVDFASAVDEAFQVDVGNEVLVPCSGPSVVPQSTHVSDLVKRPVDGSISPINFSADGSLPQIATVSGIADLSANVAAAVVPYSAMQQLTDPPLPGFQTNFTTPVVEDLEADLSSDEDAALIINEFRPLAESSIGRSVSLSDLPLVDCRATPEVVITASETAVQDLPIISKEVGFTQQVVKELYFSAGHRSLMETSRDDILDDLRNSSQQLNKIFAERSLAQHSTIKAKSPLVDQPELEVDDSMNLTEIAVLVDEDDFIPVQKKKRGRPRKTVKK